jgi:hypothetical protein
MLREFISYPKSGRSRLRFGLNCIGVEHQIHFHHDGFGFSDGAKPPHDFRIEERLKRLSRSDRVVFLKRDPRDVMVSLFHQVTGRFRDFFNYSGTISDFIRDPYFGADVLKKFLDMWDVISAQRGVLIVTYEQCAENATDVFEAVARHYDLDLSPDACRKAAEASTFENMKKIEDSGEFNKPWLRKRNGYSKVRRGKVGGYADSLSITDIAYLNARFGLSKEGRVECSSPTTNR